MCQHVAEQTETNLPFLIPEEISCAPPPATHPFLSSQGENRKALSSMNNRWPPNPTPPCLTTTPCPSPTPSALLACCIQLWLQHVTCGWRTALSLLSRWGSDGWRNKLVKVSITDSPGQIPLLKAKPGLALPSAGSALFNSALWGILLVSGLLCWNVTARRMKLHRKWNKTSCNETFYKSRVPESEFKCNSK